jgi:superfamily II DNA or RNA helicase
VADLAYHGAHTTFVVAADNTFDKKGYSRDIVALRKLPIWSASDETRTLWDHQKEAIAFCAAYGRVGRSGAPPEAGLIKMPTGTGKSGVVAVVSRCLPNIRKVLVLTPREGLVQQMLADIQRRFWHNMAVAPADRKTWDGPGVEPATIQLLLPNASRTRTICEQAGAADRLILVGTLQALDKIRSSRDRLSRKTAAALEADEQDELARLTEVVNLLKTFDLILVDEGHYEPAPSWSRSVRSLACPTLLLSATPFRNDYKLFSMRGAYAYNLPFQRAAEANIVRGVAFAQLDAAGGTTLPIDAGERDGDQQLTAQDNAAIAVFATNLLAAARTLLIGKPPGSKIIVRGGSWSALATLQPHLAGATGRDAVLIHEQARDEKKRKAHSGRYPTVKMAQADSPGSIYWLHQTKLLEGIDDASFVAVALLDDFTNDRQLVQQVGRVLRSTDPTRKDEQIATIFARNAENLARLEASWAQFLSFEEAGEGHIDSIIPGEAYLPEKIIPQMPERQYVDGRFRERLPVNLMLDREDLIVPRRTAIFDIGEGFDDEILRAEAYEGILARNRFVVQPIAGCPVNVWAWSFFAVDESPYLARHFVTEWRFGLTLIVRAGHRLFVFDTDGVPFDLKKVGVARLDRSDLVRLFAPSTASQRVRITKLAASSLDMSDRAIRMMSTSTASFEDTFTDLLDAVLLPTNVAGYVGSVPRYLGLARSKLSEATVRRVSLDDYVAWVTAIDAELTSASAANRVFERFAQLASPDLDKAAEPRNILLDLQPLDDFGAFVADREGNAVAIAAPALADVCADITAGAFQVTLLDGTALDCSISFDKKSGRYSVASEALNARVESRLSRAGTVMTLTERINTQQSFRILTDETDKVYMHGKWVKARDLVVDGRVPALDGAEIVPALKDTFVEKGEVAWAAGNTALWQSTSIFGLTARYVDPATPGTDAYAQALQEFPLILLDDDGQEMADFILVSDHKVVLLHAKAIGSDTGGTGAAVTAIQEVGRQVAASLGFFLTSSPQIEDDRWSRSYVANSTTIPTPPLGSIRIFRNLSGVATGDIASVVRAALRDRRINKEVWLVAGRLVDINVARARALSADLNNRTRQLLMYIDSLTTSCGRANARLRIFAH